MEWIKEVINFILHIDRYITLLIEQFGQWSYFFLFLIVFCETGLVVTPFLPGDSLLFAIGAFASKGDFKIEFIAPILVFAALIGDNVNYFVGKKLGSALFTKEKSRFFNKAYLDKTHIFYEKHGAKTVIIARFVPIVRTFAPFVAGIGAMEYKKFMIFSVLGALLWVTLFLGAGYLFGNISFVQKNFTLVILIIIILSILPGIYELIKAKRMQKA